MNRQRKEKEIILLRNNITTSEGFFLVGYRGLTVQKMESLRIDLRKQGGVLKVSKARLMKKAIADNASYGALVDRFKDQIGLVFAPGAVPAVAKVLYDFSKNNEGFAIVLGGLDKRILSKEDVSFVATLPSREVLLAQLCSLLNAPIRQFACAVNAVANKG